MKSELHKPMTDSDYSKIEGELQRDFSARQHQFKGGNNIQRSMMWDNMNASREGTDRNDSFSKHYILWEFFPKDIFTNSTNHADWFTDEEFYSFTPRTMMGAAASGRSSFLPFPCVTFYDFHYFPKLISIYSKF